MPFCSRCGKQNPQDASFCNYCGFQLSTPNFEPVESLKIVTLRHKYCEGTGWDTHKGIIRVRCETCGASGEVSLRIESTDRLIQCPICRGSGVDHRTSMMGVEFKKCLGTGQFPQKVLTY